MKKLLKQAFRFVGLSGIAWLIDMAVYTVLTSATQNPFISNICSSIVGASFVFRFSTKFIFQNSKRVSLSLKYGIYIIYQIVLICLISKLISVINSMILMYFTLEILVVFSALIAKILVTPITMTLNFFVTKGVIEKL